MNPNSLQRLERSGGSLGQDWVMTGAEPFPQNNEAGLDLSQKKQMPEQAGICNINYFNLALSQFI